MSDTIPDCTCWGRSPTVPVYRNPMDHLDGCPLKGTEFPVGTVTAETVRRGFDPAGGPLCKEHVCPPSECEGYYHALDAKVAAATARLSVALEESVKLQSHYATLLNEYDGGRRATFADGAAWVARLVECKKLQES